MYVHVHVECFCLPKCHVCVACNPCVKKSGHLTTGRVWLPLSGPLEPLRAPSSWWPPTSLPTPGSWVRYSDGLPRRSVHGVGVEVEVVFVFAESFKIFGQKTWTTILYIFTCTIHKSITHVLYPRGCPAAVSDRQGSGRLPLPADVRGVAVVRLAGQGHSQ